MKVSITTKPVPGLRVVHVLLIASFSVFVASVQAEGQTAGVTNTQNDPSLPTQVWTANLGLDPVAPDDLLYLTVTGSPELTKSYRVGADGTLLLPLSKQAVPAAGLRPDDIARAVRKSLMQEKILVNPIVTVSVLEYRSRLVSVVGAVRSPTTLQALGNMKLLDALARAQGIAPEAGPEIVVSRPVAGSEDKESIRISVKELFAGQDPTLNISLHGGEEILVPEAPKLYVVGNVKLPGVYPLNELGGSSVLKALAITQGTLSFTAKTAFVYRVTPGSATRTEIEIELDRILHRKAPDVPLEANDILYIPDNSKERIAASVFDHLSGFASTTASGLIIWH